MNIFLCKKCKPLGLGAVFAKYKFTAARKYTQCSRAVARPAGAALATDLYLDDPAQGAPRITVKRRVHGSKIKQRAGERVGPGGISLTCS